MTKQHFEVINDKTFDYDYYRFKHIFEKDLPSKYESKLYKFQNSLNK